MGFDIGEKVRKITGYPFEGTVCAVYPDEEKCVVKHNDKWEHIFNDKQLHRYTPEFQYLDLMKDVLERGHFREGRNGGTYSLFGNQMRFNLKDGFPLLTTKKLHFKSVAEELFWFICGETNVKTLQEKGVTIWDEWADENGNLGPIYGKQWRDFGGVDQLDKVIKGLLTDPYGRRHIVSAWNPPEIPNMALPPCHCFFQFYVDDRGLSCQLYQRSADLFLGVPFNIASYALLTHLVAKEVRMEVSEFVYTLGDVHLYANHIDQAKEQVERIPYHMPQIRLTDNKSMYEFNFDDIEIFNYDFHPHIAAPVSK